MIGTPIVEYLCDNLNYYFGSYKKIIIIQIRIVTGLPIQQFPVYEFNSSVNLIANCFFIYSRLHITLQFKKNLSK